MYRLGHVGIALALYAPVGAWCTAHGDFPLAILGGLIAVGFSTLPDVDEFLVLDHRGPTHTIWFVLVVAIGMTVAGAIVGVAVDRTITMATLWGGSATIALGSHLLADSITPMGIRPFAPLSDRHVTLNLTPAKNPRANAVLFGVGTGSVLLSQAFVTL